MEITARDRKALFILLGAALVGVLLFVFVLHKGASNSTAPPASSAGTSVTQTQPNAPTSAHHQTSGKKSGGSSQQKSVSHHQSKPPASTVTVRDPFAPLVSDPTATGTSTTP